MSLRPESMEPVPEPTPRVAQLAFPKGHPHLILRDQLGTICQDDDFADLYPHQGQPALAPWRLALVTIMPCREHLADRQAAEAVRARIDGNYLLGLELTDPGFDSSVRSEFRDRLLAGEAQERGLDKWLEKCQAMGLLQARGQQRTDSTHVLSAVGVLNPWERVAETLRATRNEWATVAPEWLQQVAPLAWDERYAKRLEDSRLPQETAEREADGQTIGEDGLAWLEALAHSDAPAPLRQLASVMTWRQLWRPSFERLPGDETAQGVPSRGQSRLQPIRELPRAAEHIASPYDVAARYRNKRRLQWRGYMAQVSETGEESKPHLLRHVHSTAATVHEAQCPEPIQQALLDKQVPPKLHLVEAADVEAPWLLSSEPHQGIDWMGPTRPNSSWQTQVEGAYSLEQLAIDWERQQVICPQGKRSTPLDASSR